MVDDASRKCAVGSCQLVCRLRFLGARGFEIISSRPSRRNAWLFHIVPLLPWFFHEQRVTWTGGQGYTKEKEYACVQSAPLHRTRRLKEIINNEFTNIAHTNRNPLCPSSCQRATKRAAKVSSMSFEVLDVLGPRVVYRF
jgi:hypothetical protein